MTPLRNLIAAGLLLSPALATADTVVFRCHASHFVRSTGELRFTVIYFNNADLQNQAVIERLTVRNALGTIIHDSGPAIGILHPTNNVDVPEGGPERDITNVPPGGTFATSTVQLGIPPSYPARWGIDPIPGETTFTADGLSLTVEASKRGKPGLFVVHARETVRQRVFNPVLNRFVLVDERSTQAAKCFPLRGRDGA